MALVKPGTTKIKVVSEENERFKRSEASYDLSIAKYKQPISFANSVLSNKDSDSVNVQQPNEKLSTHTHLKTKWSSSDSAIVRVADDASTVHLAGPGKARITLKVVGNDWYEEQSGSYEQEVYVKPTITIFKTTATSKHADAVNGTAWSPVFTDDSFKVELRNEFSEKYQAAGRAKVSLLDSNGDKELAGKEINLPSGRGITTVTFEPKPEWVDKNLKIKVVAVNSVGQESQKFGKNEIKVENKFKPHEVWSRAAIYKNYTLHHGNGNQRNTCPVASSIFVAFSYSQVNWKLKLEFDKELLHPITIVKLQADVPRDGDDVTHMSSREDIYKTYDKSGNTILDDDCVESNNGDVYTVMTTEYMGKTYNYRTLNYLYWDGQGLNMGNDQVDGFIHK
ncbi:hypothetical protein [Yersinia aldovae]|uniref:hypothetical protein n=1 Tax=Yersinia aldovae TaxID=29483 RepID=UPI0021BDBB28|nr:hypothetical protein [Yersinia aldovae]